MRKFLSVLLALCMVLGMLPPAEAEAAENGTLSKSDLNGNSVTLTQDVTVSSTIEITQNTTLDLNGHTVSYIGETGSVFRVSSGTFTLNDSGGGGVLN